MISLSRLTTTKLPCDLRGPPRWSKRVRSNRQWNTRAPAHETREIDESMRGPRIPRKFRVLASFGRQREVNASVWPCDNASRRARALINERTFPTSFRDLPPPTGSAERKAKTRRISAASCRSNEKQMLTPSLRNLTFSPHPFDHRAPRILVEPQSFRALLFSFHSYHGNSRDHRLIVILRRGNRSDLSRRQDIGWERRESRWMRSEDWSWTMDDSSLSFGYEMLIVLISRRSCKKCETRILECFLDLGLRIVKPRYLRSQIFTFECNDIETIFVKTSN